jgi:diguanylate cyclase (GGDEF)-like protein
VAALAAVAAVTLCVLPFSTHQLGATTSFVPAVMSSIFILDVVTCILLITRFRDIGDRRLLVLSLAFVWSGCLILGYVSAFPGVLSAHPPLGSWPSTAPWLYLGWHVGFPLLLAAAWCPWPGHLTEPVPVHGRVRLSILSCALTAGVAVVVVGLVSFAGHRFLPVVIHGTSTVRMSEIAGPPALILTIASAIIVTRGTRFRVGPERWVTVTAWVCVADLILTFGSLHRYSVGWYCGRAMTVVGVSLVFIAMLSEFTSLYRRLLSEQASLKVAARTDPLTGLANRSVLSSALDRRFRGTTQDCLVLLDLDRFKLVNDTFGHQAGDSVLIECSQRLLAASRPEDLVARLGGDEFALLIQGPLSPDQLGGVVRRVRMALDEPYLVDRVWPCQVGASTGSSQLDDYDSVEDAVREADRRLYQSKRARRGVGADTAVSA